MTRTKTAIVLGATGHAGQALVRELIARGVRVTATTRQTAPEALRGLDVSIANGDADTPGQLDTWIAGHDLVIDAAAPSPLGPYVANAGDPLAHARRRMQALLDAVAKHGAQLAYISSFTTLPRPRNASDVIEANVRRTVYPYFRVKQLMEDMVLHAARGGLPAVVVNPSAFMGPWEFAANRSSFVRMVMERELPIAMRHVINVIDVRDVASLIVAAVETRRYGIRIPLAGHNVAVDELARRVASMAGVGAPAIDPPSRPGIGPRSARSPPGRPPDVPR